MSSPVLAQQPEGRGSVHIAVGHFDGAGHYGDEFGLVSSTLSAEFGAEAHVLRLPSYTGSLGATLRFADAQVGIGEDDPDPLDSGFRAQNLALYARLASDHVAATLGFVFDLGPKELFEVDPDRDSTTPIDFLNSDAQHAVQLGINGTVHSGPIGLKGEATWFLTFPYDYSLVQIGLPSAPDTVSVEATVDFGDQVVLRAGGFLVAGAAEIGLDIAYAKTTAGESVLRFPEGLDLPDFPEGEFREPLRTRSLLSVIPYVTLSPTGLPLAVTLAMEAPGGAYGEHVPYGITIAGDSQTKVRFPFSIRAEYGF